MTCLFCHAQMTLATESRGYKTYRCKRGCDYHLHQEIAQTAPESYPGTQQNGLPADRDSAAIAATV